MNLEVLREAEEELNQAVVDYEEIEPGLGIRLKEEARTTFEWIRHNPELPRLRAKGYRRVNLKVFPYYIAYVVWSDAIWVLAVAHGRRRPEYWLERKSKIS
ncbi:MAG: type II toxin-antitoxin system RelE/ParE family toxin [Limisphaerales bacterium]